MRYSQLARTAVQAVFGNGLRSALTMLGLVIGISSVIILVGIGDGTNRQVSEKMKALGGDALSAYLFDGDMGYNDLSGMNDLGAVDGVAPSKSLMKKLSVGTTVANKAFVEATDEHYLHVRNLKLQEGRNLSAVDRENRSKVIVLGSDVAKTLLGSADGAVGRRIVGEAAGDAYHFVACAHKQCGGYRAIHPAAHTQRNAPCAVLARCHLPSFCIFFRRQYKGSDARAAQRFNYT